MMTSTLVVVMTWATVDGHAEDSRPVTSGPEAEQPSTAAPSSLQTEILREGLVRSLETQRSVESENRDLKARLAEVEAALAALRADSERLSGERDHFRRHVAELERQMEELSASQQSVVDRLIDRTLNDIEALEKTVAMTDLDFEGIMDRTKVGLLSQGGPFLPGAVPNDRDLPTHFQSSLGLLDLHLDRWEVLHNAVRTIPLAAPLDEYRISSRFGVRADPMNGKRAKHNGIDLKAPRRTLVFSPASGTVIYAGWKGDYGRVVEIDHGNGIVTLYAHLHKILVEKGEKVEGSDRIGLVGNSGRTTGAHLHYEIHVDGRAINPIKFLRAGQRAFSG